MAAVETEQQVTMKLMVIKERNKVLFAEARKDFVDVLFSFLTLPLGTIARLVRKE
ncbi:tyrosine/DOPA decarboxylase [Spatholobus suberectus]|nr:tyrosine/DOPA decarboxylase [Spatholobus suberectus]